MFVQQRSVILLLVLSFLALSMAADEKKVVKIKKRTGLTLGVMVSSVESDLLQKYKLKGGALIQKVLDGSEAERIGLKKGDIIIRFAGQEIENPSQIKAILRGMEEEGEVEIVIMRDGQKKTFQARVRPDKREEPLIDVEIDSLDLPDFSDWPSRLMRAMPFWWGKGGYLGVQVEDLNDQLKEYFEVSHGVLIKRVFQDSPAEKAGLKAGDVILEIEKRKIEDYDDLMRTINYYNPGDTIALKYSRKGKENTISVILDKKRTKKFDFRMIPHGEKFFPFEPPDVPDFEKLQELREKKKEIEIYRF